MKIPKCWTVDFGHGAMQAVVLFVVEALVFVMTGPTILMNMVRGVDLELKVHIEAIEDVGIVPTSVHYNSDLNSCPSCDHCDDKVQGEAGSEVDDLKTCGLQCDCNPVPQI